MRVASSADIVGSSSIWRTNSAKSRAFFGALLDVLAGGRDIRPYWNVSSGWASEDALVCLLVRMCQFLGIQGIADHVRREPNHPAQPPEFRGNLFGQGQLDRSLGLQVDDDGGSMGFPFLGGLPGNDRLQGSQPVA